MKPARVERGLRELNEEAGNIGRVGGSRINTFELRPCSGRVPGGQVVCTLWRAIAAPH